jgi:hypothetical protein
MDVTFSKTNAFHEKAGRSQVDLFLFFIKKPFLLSRVITLAPSFHPSIRTLDERCSLGASWVFSFQPVLLPVRRPRFDHVDRSWARR